MYSIFPWKITHLAFHSYKGSSAVKTTNKTTLEVHVTDKETKSKSVTASK